LRVVAPLVTSVPVAKILLETFKLLETLVTPNTFKALQNVELEIPKTPLLKVPWPVATKLQVVVMLLDTFSAFEIVANPMMDELRKNPKP
jgi:hypothetical protein